MNTKSVLALRDVCSVCKRWYFPMYRLAYFMDAGKRIFAEDVARPAFCMPTWSWKFCQALKSSTYRWTRPAWVSNYGTRVQVVHVGQIALCWPCTLTSDDIFAQSYRSQWLS